MPDFNQALIDALVRALEKQGGSFDGFNEEGLASIVYADRSILLNFDRMLRRVTQGEDPDAVVTSVLTSHERVISGPRSVEDLLGGLRCGLEPLDSVEGTGLLFQQLDDEVVVCMEWVDPEETAIRLVAVDDLDEWCRSLEQPVAVERYWQAASQNMHKLCEQECTPSFEEVEIDDTKITLGLLGTDSPFKASLILAPKALKKKFADTAVGWPVFAVVPSRDFVYIFPADERGEILLSESGLGGVVLEEYEEAPYRLSRSIFRLTDEGVEIVSAFKRRDEAILDTARQLRSTGDYEGALSACDDALEVNPDLENATLEKAYILREIGRYEEAIEQFDLVLKQNPDHGPLYRIRGVTRMLEGDCEAALDDFARALEIQGDDIDTYVYRGLAHCDLELWSDALLDFDAAAAIGKDSDASVYSKRAIALINLKQYERAILDLSHAINLDRNFLLSYYLRGWILLELGRDDEAIKDLARTFEQTSSDGEFNTFSLFGMVSLQLPDGWDGECVSVGTGLAVRLEHNFDESRREELRPVLLVSSVTKFLEDDDDIDDLIAEIKSEHDAQPTSEPNLYLAHKAHIDDDDEAENSTRHTWTFFQLVGRNALRVMVFSYRGVGDAQSTDAERKVLEKCIKRCTIAPELVEADFQTVDAYYL